MHAAIVLREDPALFGELFAELADAYVEQALFADALGIYSVLSDADQVRPICSCVQILLQWPFAGHRRGSDASGSMPPATWQARRSSGSLPMQ